MIADPLSVIRVVGKYECFVIKSIITLATLRLLPQLVGRRMDILKIHLLRSSLSGIRHWLVNLVVNQFAWHLLGLGLFQASSVIQV